MAFGIDALTKLVKAHFAAVEARLEGIQETMATQAQYDAGIAAVLQAITDANARVVADIAALQAKLLAGDPITDADLATLATAVTGAAAIDPAVIPVPAPGP